MEPTKNSPEKIRLQIKVFDSAIAEYSKLINSYKQDIESLVNICFSSLTLATIISILIPFSSNNLEFVKIYLIWIFPILLFSITIVIILVIKRKYINITAFPIFETEGDNFLQLKIKHLKRKEKMYQEISQKYYSNFKLLVRFFRLCIIGIVIFFISFCCNFYIFIFNISISNIERIFFSLFLLYFGTVLFLYLLGKQKNNSKEINFNIKSK